ASSRKSAVTLISTALNSSPNSSGCTSIVDVVGKPRDRDRLHPFADAAHQAGLPVGVEIEPARALQVLEQGEKLPRFVRGPDHVHGSHAHATTPPRVPVARTNL